MIEEINMRNSMLVLVSLSLYVCTSLHGHPGHGEHAQGYSDYIARAHGGILGFFHDDAELHVQQTYHIARRFERPTEIFAATMTQMSRAEIEALFVQDCEEYRDDNHIISAHAHGDGLLRIVSFNVRLWTDVSWHDRFDEAWSVIAQLNPDILVLQEVALGERTMCVEEKLRSLGFCLSDDWIEQQTYSFDAGAHRLTNLIAARMPIRASAKKFEHDALGYVRAEVCLPSGMTVVMYGTHLDVSDGTENIRLREMHELLTRAVQDIQEKKQVIIAGDLNSIDMSAYDLTNSQGVMVSDLMALQYRMYHGGTEEVAPQLAASLWKSVGFVDSFALADQSAPLWTSWWGGRTDYVLCSPQLKQMIHGNYVYYTSVSDHLPIIVDLITV
jgi:endonuclease/exonuclease/phosphatase family metal-dependent hydrolase